MSRYLLDPSGPTNGPVRLLCFPHAGGGPSAYGRWSALLGDAAQVLPVRLPGHEGRFDEARITDLQPLVEDLYGDVLPLLHQPYALYGHSMGALIAYALAVHIAEQTLSESAGIGPPIALIVAACRAPHLVAPVALPAGDAHLVESLQALGGLPDELVHEQAWLSALLPLVRDDLRLCEEPLAPAPRLTTPITAIAAIGDPLVPLAAVRAWRGHTEARFTLRQVVGPHLCHRDAAPAVTALVGAAIVRALRTEAGSHSRTT